MKGNRLSIHHSSLITHHSSFNYMPRYARNLVIALLLLAVLYALDYFVFDPGRRMISPYVARIIMLAGINITLAVSLNLINGFTGQFSIGHAGFMAVGAYSSAY